MKPLFAFALFLLVAFPLAAAESPVVVIETSRGDLTFTLDAEAAPLNVEAFLKRVEEKVYQESTFHHLHEKVVMGGKPGKHCTGYSGSGNFACEKGAPGEFKLKPRRGSLIMARTAGGCNPKMASNSTQFAVMFEPWDKPDENYEYTVIGQVTGGFEVLDAIAAALREKEPTPIANIRPVSK